MSGLELVSGIAGIITVSVAVIDICAQYYSGVAHARERMAGLVQEVVNLKRVLSSVQDNVVLNPEIIKAFGMTPSATLDQFTSSSPGKGDAHGRILLNECKVTLERIHDKLFKSVSGSVSTQRLRMLAWPFSDKEIQRDVERLHRCANVFQALIVTDTLAMSAKTQMELRGTRKELQDWHRTEEELHMLRWLSPLDFEAKHSGIVTIRHPGTDTWFIESDEFKEWHTTSPASDKALWLAGHPGVGKTVLSSLVIEHLKARAWPTKSAIACIYCDYDDQVAQSAQAIIGCICAQLAEQAPEMPDCIAIAYRKARNGRSHLSLEEYTELMLKIVNLFPSFFIVLDAIDELEEKKDNTKKNVLKTLDRLKDTPVRLFVTSRTHDDLKATLGSCTKIEMQASREDIKRFVVDKLESDEDLVELLEDCDELKKRLVEVILDQGGDQFLLPTLHLNRLREYTCAEEIEDNLADIIGSVDDAYAKALERVEEQPKPRRTLALAILSLISGTRRPLQLEEMQEAIAVQPDRMGISKASFRTAKMMLKVCVGLVMIEPVSHVIRFVHLTFKDYIDTRAVEILAEDVNRNMAQRCLSYLQFDAFKDGPCDDDQTFEERLRSNRFYQYAATHWGHHVKGDIEELMLGNATQLVGRNTQHLSASIQARYAFSHAAPGYSQSYPRDAGGLWIAAGFGLTLLAQKLLEEGVQVDAKTSFGETALHEASKQGYAAIITLLLQHGAEVNMPRGAPGRLRYRAAEGAEDLTHHYDTSNDGTLSPRVDPAATSIVEKAGAGAMAIKLAGAAKDRNLEEVARLLRAGASGHAVDNRGRTALHWAARDSDVEMATLLLEHGADANFLDRSDKAMRTPLLEAARNTSKKILLMRTLLDHGADPNQQATQWGEHRSPLHEAAHLGDCEKASLLLGYDANESLLDRNGQAAIDVAVSKRNLELVQLLATARLQHGHGETALHLAAAAGHVDAVRALIRHGAALGAVTSIGETPLHWAISRGQVLLAGVLLDFGADADATTSSGENALHIAAAKGDAAAVELVAPNMKNINALSKAGQTALHAASFNGVESVVSFLLSLGAEIDARGQLGATPLIGAAGRGLTVVVSILIAHGADVGIHHGYDGKTALHRSAQAGHVAASEVIMNRGADIEARDDDQNTPLRLASSDGRIRSPILECLLLRGADVGAVDVWGETPLQRASFKGHLDNVRTLLKHGASPAAQDPSRWCEEKGQGWPFLQQVTTAADQGSGRYKTMDVRGWPAAVQAALMGEIEIVEVLLAHDPGAKDRWGNPELLLSLAEHRRKVNREREMQGKRVVTEGGWTDIELKMSEYWDVVEAVEA